MNIFGSLYERLLERTGLNRDVGTIVEVREAEGGKLKIVEVSIKDGIITRTDGENLYTLEQLEGMLKKNANVRDTRIAAVNTDEGLVVVDTRPSGAFHPVSEYDEAYMRAFGRRDKTRNLRNDGSFNKHRESKPRGKER